MRDDSSFCDDDLVIAPPLAPLAMPKQVLEYGHGGLLVGLVARLVQRSARSEG
ncbi:hypothetical protein Rsw2DRAFT_2989 [Rhodobacter ferrooxidans]|uniref:Uncharacterized protein n=2 Tax=Rhodobacter ferrooxidans TaxID=371731 RepID=C8S4L1_9RHOB|nr:hypothetical protein Rsw2DRAFT_2989 [Rhodobacter sp. SW2]